MSEFLVEKMLRTGSISLVGGAVGAAKTTFLLQLAESVGLGKPFFGHTTKPSTIAYVSVDRSREETLETLARLQLSIPAMTLFPVDELTTFPTIETIINKICPNFGLVIIEPFDYLLQDPSGKTGNPNDKMHVFQFLLRARRTLKPYASCVVGSMHTTKASGDHRYLIARERISGSSAWTANTFTSVLIENVDPSDETSTRRTITIMPRNFPNLVIDAYLEDGTGRLIESEIPDNYLDIHEKIRKAPPGTEFDNAQLKAWADLAGVNPRSMRRFLDSRIEKGELVDGGRGVWRKARLT